MEHKVINTPVHSCKYHVVWCSKYRRNVLVGEIEIRLKELIEQACAEMSVEIIKLELKPDYVHLLLDVDPQLGIHRTVKAIKSRSSHTLRSEFPELRSRIPTLWTNSYFVSTFGNPSDIEIKQYIENQNNA